MADNSSEHTPSVRPGRQVRPLNIKRLSNYYQLAKPGIVYGNALPLIAAFSLGAILLGRFPLVAFVGALTGQSLVIAGSCALNNVLDRHLDARMARTRRRAVVAGAVGPRTAVAYGLGLIAGGLALLIALTNPLTAGLGLLGAVLYVAVYGYAKRHTSWGTLVGCAPGALPPVAGYTAATGRIDLTAGLLFAALVCWQMAHFYAIGLYRRDDYAAARLPIWPVVHGSASTKRQIILFAGLFAAALAGLTVAGTTGWVFAVLAVALGGRWVWLGVRGFAATDDVRWGKRMFGWSLVALLAICALIPLGALLP